MSPDPRASGLRLIQIVNTLDHTDGGPARNAFELNLALNALPHVEAALVSMVGDERDSVSRTFSDQGGQLPPTPPRRLRPRGRAGAGEVGLISALREARRADALVLHGYYLWWVPVFTAAGLISGTRVFLMPHGALTRYERGRKKGKKAVFHLAAGWWVNGRLTAFVTGSEVEKDELIADGIGRRVEYAGVGTALVSSPPQDRVLADPVRLLTMSRLAAKKRVDVAVQAVRHLLDSGLRVSLTVAGTGDSETERSIRDLIESLRLTDAVQMVGLVKGEDKERLLAESDIFLLPSEDENFGIGVAEAAMHGLFVVASSKVAAATMLSDESASKLDSTDPRSFANAVERAASDHPVGARSQISAEARELFSWSAVAQRWVSILGDRSRD